MDVLTEFLLHLWWTTSLILNRKTDELKSMYLIDLCKELYLKDIEDRHNLRGENVMAALVNILASAVGSLIITLWRTSSITSY